MRARFVAGIAVAASLGLSAPAVAQSDAPRPGPFDALPAPAPLDQSRLPDVTVEGLGTAESPTPQPTVDRARHYVLPDATLTVRAGATRVRVRLLRVRRDGRRLRTVRADTLAPGRSLRHRLTSVPTAMHTLRLGSGRRRQTFFLYTPAGGGAAAFLPRRAYRPGDTLDGEILITGDTPMSGDACGGIEELRDGDWRPPRTRGSFACIALLMSFRPGSRHPFGFGVPDDLPPGHYRYVRRLDDAVTRRRVLATAEFAVG